MMNINLQQFIERKIFVQGRTVTALLVCTNPHAYFPIFKIKASWQQVIDLMLKI